MCYFVEFCIFLNVTYLDWSILFCSLFSLEAACAHYQHIEFAVEERAGHFCRCITLFLYVLVCECTYICTCMQVSVNASMDLCIDAAHSCMEGWSIITIHYAVPCSSPLLFLHTNTASDSPHCSSSLSMWTRCVYEHGFVATPGCMSLRFCNYGFISPQVARWTASPLLLPSSARPAAWHPQWQKHRSLSVDHRSIGSIKPI